MKKIYLLSILVLSLSTARGAVKTQLQTGYIEGFGKVRVILSNGQVEGLQEDRNHCQFDDFGEIMTCTYVNFPIVPTTLQFVKKEPWLTLYAFTSIPQYRLVIGPDLKRLLRMDQGRVTAVYPMTETSWP